MTSLAPIVLFTYKRVDTLKKTIESLNSNLLAKASDLIIYSDGAKIIEDRYLIDEVRSYLKTISGFKSIVIHYSHVNKGLANSIIDGVSSILKEYDNVIVLEDDLIVSKKFLIFMNQSLHQYKNNKKVFSISGYSIPITIVKDYRFDVYFTPRSSSWGWATWNDRWETIDWEMKDYTDFRTNKKKISEFNQGGSDMSGMLERQMQGEINSWAIRWCYHQFKVNMLTVYPVISNIQNIGFSNQATHSNVFNRYWTTLDIGNKTEFNLPKDAATNHQVLAQFQDFFSVKTRVYNKLKTYLYKAGILSNNND